VMSVINPRNPLVPKAKGVGVRPRKVNGHAVES
jgi:hypothetical protein